MWILAKLSKVLADEELFKSGFLTLDVIDI